MSGERFYVVELDGFTITGGSATPGNAKPQLTCSVLDRAYCHREVARFTPRVYRTMTRERLREKGRADAAAEAARLNAWAATA